MTLILLSQSQSSGFGRDASPSEKPRWLAAILGWGRASFPSSLLRQSRKLANGRAEKEHHRTAASSCCRQRTARQGRDSGRTPAVRAGGALATPERCIPPKARELRD